MSGERQISCSDVGEEGNKQNNIKLNGETPTSCYQTTNWAEWEDQHAHDDTEPGVCLILMPLKSIETTQKDALETQFSSSGAKVCVINGETNSHSMRKSCGEGKYTHSRYDVPNDIL